MARTPVKTYSMQEARLALCLGLRGLGQLSGYGKNAISNYEEMGTPSNDARVRKGFRAVCLALAKEAKRQGIDPTPFYPWVMFPDTFPVMEDAA